MSSDTSAMLLNETGGALDRVVGFETEYGFCAEYTNREGEQVIYSFPESSSNPQGMPPFKLNQFDNYGNRKYMDIGPHPEFSTAEETDFLGAAHRIIIGHLVVAKIWRENPPFVNGFQSKIHLLANNIDPKFETWGCHENYLASRQLEKEKYITPLAIHNLSRIVWAGSGVVLRSSRQSQFNFGLSERADHIWDVEHSGTTRSRPLVNLRDNPYADEKEFRRIHIICGDSVMSPFANALKMASTSIILRACEIGVDFSDLMPANPIKAIREISHDPKLQQKVELEDGRKFSGIDLQRAIRERAVKAAGKRHYMTAQEKEWAEKWGEVLDDLSVDPQRCLSRVDWVLKRASVERELEKADMKERSTFDVAQTKAFDFHRLLPDEGLGMKLLRSDKQFYESSPNNEVFEGNMPLPEKTRAKLRATLLRRIHQLGILSGASWNYLEIDNGKGATTLSMGDPSQSENEELMQKLEEFAKAA